RQGPDGHAHRRRAWWVARSRGVVMVGSWKLWQGWVNVVAGVLVFISPFVFAATGNGPATWTALVGGVLTVVAALWMLMQPAQRIASGAAVVIGVLLFIAPWVLGFVGVAGVAWTVWILGAVIALSAASTFVTGRQRAALSH
ncbi:MAG: SPW repeat protein, partial [Candidatus Dormiibacterota bacterium]